MGERERPQWLEPFLHADYYSVCERHRHLNNSKCNFYCINCMVGAICPHCRASGEHPNHTILQIRKASSACGVDTEEIGALIDTAGLHKFKINTAYIYFLCGRTSHESKRKPPCMFDSVCVQCSWTLPYGHTQGTWFCSIDCKMKYGSSPCPARVAANMISSRAEATAVEPSPESTAGLCVRRSHGRRGREDGSNHAVKDDPMVVAPYKLVVPHENSRRVRSRKGTPHRCVEFVIPDERRYWFHPF